MDKQLNELNDLFNKIKIPENLDNVIDHAINRERNRKKKIMRSKNKLLKTISAAAACLILMVGLTVNLSYVFAQEIYKVPVIGALAKMMTFREYTIQNDTSIGKVIIPNVEITDNQVVQNFINDTINKKVNEIVEEQAILDAEYKEAYLETGGTEEDYKKIEMTVDYQLYYVSDHIISFEISKYQTLAPAYNENYFYNINLKTADEITIKNVLGENYAALIKDSVEQQMLNRMKENSDLSYDLDYFKNMTINEDRSFYVQENGDITIVFAPYEVASGYMGQQEFIVENINNVGFPDAVAGKISLIE